jgi:hypothetical protein
MEFANDARRHTRENSGIRLDRNGRWWHDGVPIEHPKIMEAFNRGLSPTDDGRFRLDFGNDWCFVQVDDAAYHVIDFDVSEQGAWLNLSDRSLERLDPATLSVDDDGVLACRVKRGRAKARFSRDAQVALGEQLVQSGNRLSLKVGQQLIEVPLSVPPMP